MTFAELLKSHRDSAGLTQKALAEKAGLTQAGIALYESGQREPTWAAVQKLADALGVPVTAFRESAPAAEPVPPPAPKKPAPKKPKK